MNAPIDTLAFAERFENAGFGHEQARALAVAFGNAHDVAREDTATKSDLASLKTEIFQALAVAKAELLQAVAENGKDVSGRLWSTVTIIAGVSTAISAVIGAGVTLLFKLWAA